MKTATGAGKVCLWLHMQGGNGRLQGNGYSDEQLSQTNHVKGEDRNSYAVM